MTWLLRHRFRVLLIAVVLLMVVYPMLRTILDAEVVLNILLTVLFLGAILVVFQKKQLRVASVLLGIPTLVSLWTNYALPGLPELPVAVAMHLCAALFLGLTVATILSAIHSEKEISADSIYGAFCGYLVMGLLFAHVYCIVELIGPGSFQGTAEVNVLLQKNERRHFLLSYFSFVTMTTVGFGDVIPVSEGARSLAIVEAILGQFYIAVLMAELIGKRVAQALSG